MFCYNCGKQIDDKAAFCVFCGADQREEAIPAAVTAQPMAEPAPQPAPPAAPVVPVEVAPPVSQPVEEPVQPVAPAVPAVSTAPITPEIPDIPEVPYVPAVPVAATMPEEPVAPVAPAQPEEPATPAEPTPFVVNIPELKEIPDVPVAPATPAAPVAPVQPVAPAAPAAPVAPIQPVAPAAPAAPVAPVQPVAPATPAAPAAPVQPVAPAIPAAPVAPPQPVAIATEPMVEEVPEKPRKKKMWILWVVLSVVLVLAAVGAWLYFQWQAENAHKEALTDLMTVAVEGDFSKIESLAPVDFWDKAGVDKARLAGAGEIWLSEVLPNRLQEIFTKQADVHYDSFGISPEPEILADQAVDDATKKDLTTILQANYGIPAKRITDVRYLEIHITLSAAIDKMEHMSTCKEKLFMVQMGDTWYPVTIDGAFAVERVVELIQPKLLESEADKRLSGLSPNEDATTGTKKTNATTKKSTKTTKK